MAGPGRCGSGGRQHIRRLCRDRADACDVQEEGEEVMLSLLSAGAEGTPVNPWAALAYLVAGVFFILALRGLSSPARSRTGNRFGMAGMQIGRASCRERVCQYV